MRTLITALAGWVCGYCGTANPTSNRSCKSCGTEMW